MTSKSYTIANGLTTSQVSDIIPLDDQRLVFDGIENRFYANYQGTPQSITNPFRLLIAIDGIIQTVGFQDYVWQSPITPYGFFIDSDGYISYTEVPPAGSTFNGSIQVGPVTTSITTIYPFRALDILIGA
jgi:hypothetical protein